MRNVTINLQDVVGKGYNKFWNDKKLYRVCKGSRGSKKSKTTFLNLVTRIMEYPLANALVVRQVYSTLRDSCFADIKWAVNRLQVQDKWEFHKSPLEVIYKPTGQKILFRGCDNALNITSLSVETGVLCWLIIEEAYQISEDSFNKLDMSIRGQLPTGYFKQCTLIFNPWSANSWLKARFFDVEDEDISAYSTTYKQNEWLSDTDIKIFEKMKRDNPRRYNIEGLGNWGISEGLIYENVEVKDLSNLETRNLIEFAGLDFGWSDENAIVYGFIDNEEKIIYIKKELLKNHLTNKQIADEIKKLGIQYVRITCDSAEPKSIQELKNFGVNATACQKGQGSVNYGIQLIQNYKIVIDEKCEKTQEALNQYCWAKDKNDKPTDKPEHEFSHIPDALRYGVIKYVDVPTFSWE